MLFNELPNGAEFSFEIDQRTIYAIKIDDNTWIYNTKIEGKQFKGVYITPLEDEWDINRL